MYCSKTYELRATGYNCILFIILQTVGLYSNMFYLFTVLSPERYLWLVNLQVSKLVIPGEYIWWLWNFSYLNTWDWSPMVELGDFLLWMYVGAGIYNEYEMEINKY